MLCNVMQCYVFLADEALLIKRSSSQKDKNKKKRYLGSSH